MVAIDSLISMDTIEGTPKRTCFLNPPSLKRIVLNPRAYLTPFVVFIIFHHVPMFMAYGLVNKPAEGYDSCHRLQELFRWLYVSFLFHLILALMMFAAVIYTLSTRVYHERRPEVRSIAVGLCLFDCFNGCDGGFVCDRVG